MKCVEPSSTIDSPVHGLIIGRLRSSRWFVTTAACERAGSTSATSVKASSAATSVNTRRDVDVTGMVPSLRIGTAGPAAVPTAPLFEARVGTSKRGRAPPLSTTPRSVACSSCRNQQGGTASTDGQDLVRARRDRLDHRLYEWPWTGIPPRRTFVTRRPRERWARVKHWSAGTLRYALVAVVAAA